MLLHVFADSLRGQIWSFDDIIGVIDCPINLLINDVQNSNLIASSVGKHLIVHKNLENCQQTADFFHGSLFDILRLVLPSDHIDFIYNC